MRKTGLVAVGLAAALVLSGCGTKETPGQASAPGEGTSGSEGPSLFTSALDLAGAVGSKSKDKQSAKMTFEMDAAGTSMKGDGAYRLNGQDVAMQMSMDMAQLGKMEMRLVDKVFYIKLPAELASQMGGKTGGKPWVKIATDGSDPVGAALGKQMESIGDNVDVTKQIDQIKQAGEITNSAKETLDGEQVTHYTIKLDTAKLAEQQTDADQKKAMQELNKQGVKNIDMDLWTNAENLPVKITTGIPVQGQSINISMRYTDWGQPVNISAPPADQVGEMPRR